MENVLFSLFLIVFLMFLLKMNFLLLLLFFYFFTFLLFFFTFLFYFFSFLLFYFFHMVLLFRNKKEINNIKTFNDGEEGHLVGHHQSLNQFHHQTNHHRQQQLRYLHTYHDSVYPKQRRGYLGDHANN